MKLDIEEVICFIGTEKCLLININIMMCVIFERVFIRGV